MTVKLIILKSGEDVIADIQEMVVGPEDDQKVIGYFLTKPCIIKLSNRENLTDSNGNSSFEISMFPWNPLSKDTRIPITADWVVTIVDPIEKVKKMYETNVLEYGKDNQNSSSDESTDTGLTD